MASRRHLKDDAVSDTGRVAGFTAVELLVTMVILATLISLTWLAQARILPHHRLSSAVRQVVTDLRLARAKAIAQNTRFQIAFTSGGTTYAAQRCTASGSPPTWACQPYALYARGSTVAGSPQPIELSTSVVSNTAATLAFDPRGTVSGASSLVFAVPAAGITRTVTINIAGLITIS